jgi:thioredoxin reductase (NADPH)
VTDKLNQTKVLILGSGAAGLTAAIYAARANLEPIVLKGMQPGGQLTITTEVENYPGFAHAIQGPWLMEQMQEQAKNVGARLINDNVKDIDLSGRPFKVYGETGETYIAETLVVATGASAKWLNIASEKEFMGFGVSGCATCDGFFFKNCEVAVVGGGNTAVEEALYLTNHASKVYLIHRRDKLRAEKILQDRLFNNPKIEVIWNSEVEEIKGNLDPKEVTSVILYNSQTKSSSELKIQGIFIAIGHSPNTEIFKGKLDLDESGYILTAPGTTLTSVPGLFAAGDVQDKIYRQAITADRLHGSS